MKKQQKKPELVKLGSDDMVYWRNLIDAKKLDLQLTEENLKFYKFLVYYAEIEYKKAEEEYNKQSANSRKV